MRKLRDFNDEEAVELWADILEPVGVIMEDKEAVGALAEPNKMKGARVILEKHKTEVVEILRQMGLSPINGITIPIFLVEILVQIGESPEIMDFLSSQGQETAENASGPVMGVIEGGLHTS